MSHSVPDPSAPPAARRGPTPALWVAVVVVAALLVGGATWYFTSRSSASVEATAERADASTVTLEAFGSPGADPFVAAEPITATAPQWVAIPPAPAGDPGDPRLVGGDTPRLYGTSPTGSTALYGGSNEQSVCDPEQLVAFLAENPAEATAWASVFGRSIDEIAGFVRSLTPVVLLRDTAVTNHGFAGGAAVARPAVLQAGTAVLVDEFGVPAVRCACGNPLLPAQVTDLPSAAFVGERWAGFDPAAILSVRAAAAPQTTFTLVDVVTGQPLALRAGTETQTLAAVGEAGVALSDDGVTWHPVAESPAGRQIAAGNGVLVVPGATTVASTDGGLTWAAVAGAPADATFAAYDGRQWRLLTEPDPYGIVVNGQTPTLRVVLHSSPDLTTWTSQEVTVPLEALPPAEYAATTYVDVVSLGAGDARTAIGVLVADHEGTHRQYLLSSTDLASWQSTTLDAAVLPAVAWDGQSWAMAAFRYDGALRDGTSHGLTGRPSADLSSVTLAPTTDDVGLGSLDHSPAAGWIAAGWRGADWQDPALYTSADLTTWTRVSELPGHGFDVAVVSAGSAGPPELTGLPTLAAPVLVTGSGCPVLADRQPIVTAGQLTCAAVARVLFDSSGPQTGGHKVAPRWHHWGCSWDVIPEVEAGRSPALSCSRADGSLQVDYWPADKAPTGTATPTATPGGDCVHTNRYGTFDYTLFSGSMPCAERIAVLDAYFDRRDQGDYGPAAGWVCLSPSGEDLAYSCNGNGVVIRAVPAGAGASAGGAPGGSAGGSAGGTDAGITVSQPMATPACDGTPIVIYASAVTPGRYEADVQAALDAHPGSSWVRTDRSCTSFAQATADGGPIYAVFKPFASVAAACAEVAAVGDAAGRRFLDTGSPSTSVYSCS